MKISDELNEFLDNEDVQELINNNEWDDVFFFAIGDGVEYELKECIEAANIAGAKNSIENIENIRFKYWKDNPDEVFADDNFADELYSIRSAIFGPGRAITRVERVSPQTYIELTKWESDSGNVLVEWSTEGETEMILNALENNIDRYDFEKDMEDYYREVLEDK